MLTRFDVGRLLLGVGCPGATVGALRPCSFRLEFWKCLPCGGRVPLPCKGLGWVPSLGGASRLVLVTGVPRRSMCGDETRASLFPAIPFLARSSGWRLPGLQHEPSFGDRLPRLAFGIRRLPSRHSRKNKMRFHGLSARNTLTPLILITERLLVFLLIKAGKRLCRCSSGKAETRHRLLYPTGFNVLMGF